MNKRIVILGAGESGVGSAILAKQKGFEVFVSDMSEIAPKYKSMLEEYQLDYEEKKHTEAKILNAGEVIKSPGIPDKAPLIKKIHESGIPVISEIEFAGRYTSAIKICITGSNGKTTTTMLTYHILRKAGLNVGLAGNVGQSFALQVAQNHFDYYVIELSSFQLDGMFTFKAELAVLLNITPDHLDRYDYKFQNYIDSKFRILQNQTENDVFVYCSDDEVIIKELEEMQLNSKNYAFTLKDNPQGNGAYLSNDTIHLIDNNKNVMTMTIHELALQGKHNVYNSMAASIVGHVLDIRKDVIRESLMDFKNVEHRLEPVIKVHGVEFINDSKATNVNSAWYALECMKNPVVWIVGGVDKGNDYSMLNDLVRQKVKAIVCLGVDNSKIHSAFEDIVPKIIDTNSMDDAVNAAYRLASDGEIVLLSPACASFDLFKNYEERGYLFKRAVRNL
ncbi:MAG TPA: UDP-N-acetylmuramoyl-L-alanine--D-glutamate ligase [Bacteroidales bacterium]|nr:UDP-N-acetylmuramoyl-L-alanine--D-glutamate ligase [Bacteroidales bacterium]